jgi:hypothetical protein
MAAAVIVAASARRARPWRPVLQAAMLSAAIAGFAAPSLGAEPVDWLVGKTRGTVLALSGDTWAEIGTSTAVPMGTPVRTLQGGYLELLGEGVTITLGALSAVSVDLLSGRLVLTQYAGSLQVEAQLVAGGLIIQSKAVRITIGGGYARLTVDIAGEVEVDAGSATVAVAGEPAVVVSAGQSTSTIEGEVTDAGVVGATNAANANSNATNNAGGNVNSNTGGNDNSGGNGNGNNGNGNGGNGNGNGNGAGGGGQGNGAGGGVGNNGNGNGNGNGNSNGNGNGNGKDK